MLLSSDIFLLQDLSSNLFIYIIIFYFILSGIIVQLLLIKIDNFIPTKIYSHTPKTINIRKFFYFITGGVIIPMILLILIPFSILSISGEIIERKFHLK